jgi:HAD superfamily hydrolase (TIGR01509 family)
MDSEPVHFLCWSEVLAPFGIKLAWDSYASNCIGVSDRAMLEAFARDSDPPVTADELWAQYPVKQECFRRRIVADPPFAPGLREFIAELTGAYRLAVVSSSARAEVEPMLERAGIREYLGTVVCREDVKRHKPAPDPYLLAASRLGVQSALVAEDSEAGIASALAAGFEVVRIPSPTQTVALVESRLAAS